MNRNINKKDVAVLASFTAFLILVMVVIISRAAGNSPDSASEEPKTSPVSNRSSASLSTRVQPRSFLASWEKEAEAADYSAIERSPLFGPAVEERRSARIHLPPPPKMNMSLPPVSPVMPAVMPPEGPAQDKVTVVGVVRIDGETHAVVEDMSRGETKFVPLGGEAFGYRVLTVGDREATLTKNGKQYAIALGENKAEAKPKPPAQPAGAPVVAVSGVPGAAAPTPAAGGPPRGDRPDGVRGFFGNMSEEERNRMRDQLRNMSPDERREYFRSRMQSGGGN